MPSLVRAERIYFVSPLNKKYKDVFFIMDKKDYVEFLKSANKIIEAKYSVK